MARMLFENKSHYKQRWQAARLPSLCLPNAVHQPAGSRMRACRFSKIWRVTGLITWLRMYRR